MTAPPDGFPQTTPRALPSWLLLAGLALVLVAVWRFTPVRRLLDVRFAAELARVIADAPAAPAIVVLVYLGATLVLCPMTPLLAATALVFDPWRAFGIGLVGALSSAALGYGLGRLVARRRPRWIESARFAPLRARLRRRGILTMAGARLAPVGNFTLMNVGAAAIGIPARDFLLGNALGLVPTLLALTVLSHEARQLGWLR